MLEALSRQTGVPLDVPFEQLSVKQRRIVMHGLDDDWIDVLRTGGRKKTDRPLFRFQYKGLYPALEEAARLSPALRARWEHLVDEVDCAVCGGSRLRDDASAVRLKERDDRRIVPPAAGRPVGDDRRLEARRAGAQDRRRVAPRSAEPAAVSGRRGAGISDAGARRCDAFRRRSPTHSFGQPGRQRAVRRALCARRADDRPASARQPPPACRAGKAARPGQHAAGGRARSRGAGRRRSVARFRSPGRGRRRRDRGPRHAGTSRQTARLGDGSVPLRKKGDTGAEQSAHAFDCGHRGPGRRCEVAGRQAEATNEASRSRTRRACASQSRPAGRRLAGNRRRAAQ